MTNPWIVFGVLLAFAAIVIGIYIMWPQECPAEIQVLPDGTIHIVSTGKSFESMHAFQQWWSSSEFKDRCPIPLQTGKGGRIVETHEIPPENEQTYAKTPINKVDDYNRILFDRSQDWVNKPYSSDERKQIAAQISTVEGFDGVPKQVVDSVLQAYGTDTEYEPVITQTGENHWEVTELKPKRSSGKTPVHTDQMGSSNAFQYRTKEDVQSSVDPYVSKLSSDSYQYGPDPVSTQTRENHWEVTERKPKRSSGSVLMEPMDAHISFQYRTKEDIQNALDPYFSQLSSDSYRYGPDPFVGPVPGMERMFGPTLHTTKWV